MSSFCRVPIIALLAVILFPAGALKASSLASDDCLNQPTIACITEHYSRDADKAWSEVTVTERSSPTAWLIKSLISLDQIDEAERVARREPKRGFVGERASEIAVARYLAGVRLGTIDTSIIETLDEPSSPLAPLTGSHPNNFRAWSAYQDAAYGLLRDFARVEGVSEASLAPMTARQALAASEAWQSIIDGIARWNERVMPALQLLGWRVLAQLHLDLGDEQRAVEALQRIGSAPASDDEVALWWRLGDRTKAGQRARTTPTASVLGRHLRRMARAALLHGDGVQALSALAEAWPLGMRRDGVSSVDLYALREMVSLTAAAGARNLAISRAMEIRSLQPSLPVRNYHWPDAIAALNDIGAHHLAAENLQAYIAQLPPNSLPTGIVQDLYRAGLKDDARRLLEDDAKRSKYFDVPYRRSTGGHELTRRLQWAYIYAHGVHSWERALHYEADNRERFEGLLSLSQALPSQDRIQLLKSAVRLNARRGRASQAIDALSEAITLVTKQDQPYSTVCSLMELATSLGREDLVDLAFRVAVDAARTEPLELRGAILLYSAACRKDVSGRVIAP